jgi:nicotinate-nucleotide adenylyltransferase
MWIITKKNPLKKKPYLSTKTRIKLSKEITKKEKKILVCYLDHKVKSNNTFDLLNYIKKKNINSQLFFLMGSDNLINFCKWNNYKKIPRIAKIIVFARGNYSINFLKSIVAKKLHKNDWKYINSKKINISSSLIRKI